MTTQRPLIGPEPYYPTPWRVAEKRGNHHVIECSEGHYCAEVPNGALAELIVAVVNNAAPDADPSVCAAAGTEDDR